MRHILIGLMQKRQSKQLGKMSETSKSESTPEVRDLLGHPVVHITLDTPKINSIEEHSIKRKVMDLKD